MNDLTKQLSIADWNNISDMAELSVIARRIAALSLRLEITDVSEMMPFLTMAAQKYLIELLTQKTTL